MTDGPDREMNPGHIPHDMRESDCEQLKQDLKALVERWEDQREDPIKHRAAEAQLWVCIDDLKEVLADE